MVDTSEGEISDSEESDSGTREPDYLVLSVEEQLDYYSFHLPTASVTRASLWNLLSRPLLPLRLSNKLRLQSIRLSQYSGEAFRFSNYTPAQAQIQPSAPTQPLRLAPANFPQPQAASLRGATRMPSESLHDENRLLDFPESEASLIHVAKQACSELLDRVANFCELDRGEIEDKRKVMGMNCPTYHDPARASINLALPWHSIAKEIADLNFDIVTAS